MPISDYNRKVGVAPVSKSGSPTVSKAVMIRIENASTSTGTGRFTIPFDNVSGPEDIAVYDSDGNLLNYHIVNPGVINGSNTTDYVDIYVWNDWVFDGTIQAQLAYGNNDAATDRSDEQATWTNTGQNCEVALLGQTTSADDSSGQRSFNANAGISIADRNTVGMKAFSADGSTDAYIKSDTWKGITGTNARTIAFDTYEPSGPNDAPSFVKWGTDDFGAKYSIRGDSDNFTGISPRIEITGGYVTADVDLSSGYHNVILTLPDGASDVTDHTWYVDGTQPQTSSGSQSINTGNNQDVNIGNRPFSQHDMLNGEIDNIRIYSDEKGQVWAEVDHEMSSWAGHVALSQETVITSQSISEVFSVDDSEDTSMLKRLYETAGISDVQSSIRDYVRSIDQALGLSGATARTADYFRSVSDSVGLNGVITRGSTFLRTVSDSISLNDTLDTFSGLLATATANESLSLNDDATVTDLVLGRIIEETPSLDGTIDRTGEFYRNISDSVGVDDVAERTVDYIRSVSDSLGLADATERVADYTRTATSTLGLDTVTDRAATFKRTVSEGVGIVQQIVSTYIKIPRLGEDDDTSGSAKETDDTDNAVVETDDTDGFSTEEDTNRKP